MECIILVRGPAPMRNPFPFVHNPKTLDRDRIIVYTGGTIRGAAQRLGRKYKGEAWGRNLPPDAGNDLTTRPDARNPYESLVQDRRPKAKVLMLCFREHGAESRSTIRRPIKPLSRRTTTRTRGVRIATRVGSPPLPRTFQLPALSARCARRHSRVILATNGRACAGGDGGQGTGNVARRRRLSSGER